MRHNSLSETREMMSQSTMKRRNRVHDTLMTLVKVGEDFVLSRNFPAPRDFFEGTCEKKICLAPLQLVAPPA